MARSNKPVNPAAENALDKMKFEIASELGIAEKVRSTGWNTMTSADCGRVGGHMVRKMIEQYESGLSGSAATAGTMGGTTASGATGSTLTAQFDVNGKA
jgi:hypothetical protein